MVVSASLPNIT